MLRTHVLPRLVALRAAPAPHQLAVVRAFRGYDGFGFGKKNEESESSSARRADGAEKERERVGAQQQIRALLKEAGKPLTSAELWAVAELDGVKSKRFMKQMLNVMRQRGLVFAKPLGGGRRHKTFSYVLREDFAQAIEARRRAEQATETRRL